MNVALVYVGKVSYNSVGDIDDLNSEQEVEKVTTQKKNIILEYVPIAQIICLINI
jgi:hypothetical protein